MVTEHETRFVNKQGEIFNTLAELEEYELLKRIHKNLYLYLIQKLKVKDIRPIFEFLIKNRAEVCTLLTNGNLETKYHNRALK